MESSRLLSILWRWRWVISLTIIIAATITLVYTWMTQTTYSAKTTIRVAASADGPSNINDYGYNVRLINTFGKVAGSRTVMEKVMQELSLSRPPKISINYLPNTELIEITVEDKDPVVAANIANTLAKVTIYQGNLLTPQGEKSPVETLMEQRDQAKAELDQSWKDYENLIDQSPSEVEQIRATGKTIQTKQDAYITLLEQYYQVRSREVIRENIISVLEPAVTPEYPSKPRPALDITLGILAGLAAGIGLAFLFEKLDPGLYEEGEIEAAAKLHTLSRIRKAKEKDKFLSFIGNPPPSDEFRSLRTNILCQNHATRMKTIMITSPSPKDGKSTITASLAMAMARAGLKVIVLDGDMRAPRMHTYFELDNEVGLSNYLRKQAPFEKVIQKTLISGIDIISSGQTTSKPSELLCSSDLTDLLDRLCNQYDIVLVDSPAILAAPDAAVVAPQMDGVIMVVCRDSARRDTIEEASSQMKMVNAKMLGIVINQAPIRRGYANYYNQLSS